jgi:hypothetical protein
MTGGGGRGGSKPHAKIRKTPNFLTIREVSKNITYSNKLFSRQKKRKMEIFVTAVFTQEISANSR